MVELRLHHLFRGGEAADRELVEHDVVGGAAGPAEHALAARPGLDDLGRHPVDVALQPLGLRAEPGELLGLQEARHERHGELANGLGARLEVGVERLALAHVLVGLPPAPLARLAGEGHDLGPPLVIDAERIEDAHDVVLVGDVAVLEAGDLRPALADALGQLLVGQPGVDAQLPQLAGESLSTHVWTDHPAPRTSA